MYFYSEKFNCWILIILSVLSTHGRVLSVNKDYSILEDSNKLDSVGYDADDMNVNGELDVMSHMIHPGDLVFDIGANEGEWTRHVLNRHTLVRICAFEPVPALFKQCQNKMSTNVTVSCFNVALDASVGMRSFVWYRDSRGNETSASGFFNRPANNGLLNSTTIEVKTDTIDNFCFTHAITYVHFIKIDTEGAELDILRGAEKLLNNKAIGAIQFEYGGTYPDAKITLHQVYDLLTSYGYSIFRIMPGGLIRVVHWRDALESYRFANYLAVSPEKLGILKVLTK